MSRKEFAPLKGGGWRLVRARVLEREKKRCSSARN